MRKGMPSLTHDILAQVKAESSQRGSVAVSRLADYMNQTPLKYKVSPPTNTGIVTLSTSPTMYAYSMGTFKHDNATDKTTATLIHVQCPVASSGVGYGTFLTASFAHESVQRGAAELRAHVTNPAMLHIMGNLFGEDALTFNTMGSDMALRYCDVSYTGAADILAGHKVIDRQGEPVRSSYAIGISVDLGRAALL